MSSKMASQHRPYRPNVGIMLLNATGALFVAHRIDIKGDAWQLPQGGIDGAETPLEAAYRELKEETGITDVSVIAESKDWISYDFPTHLQHQIWDGKYQGQRQKWFLMRYLGRDADICLETQHPEFSSWKWIAPQNLIEIAVDFKKESYQAVLKEFAKHLT